MRCGHIERKDLDTARQAKRFSKKKRQLEDEPGNYSTRVASYCPNSVPP